MPLELAALSANVPSSLFTAYSRCGAASGLELLNLTDGFRIVRAVAWKDGWAALRLPVKSSLEELGPLSRGGIVYSDSYTAPLAVMEALI